VFEVWDGEFDAFQGRTEFPLMSVPFTRALTQT
jgi:hypothetical protein